MNKIEVEFRSILLKNDFVDLEHALQKVGHFLGEDDRDVTFFLMDGKLLKISNNISLNTAKVSLKLNEIGNGSSFEEIEFHIPIVDTTNAVRLFQQLGFNKIQKSYQKRRNYLYKNVTIALKYSEAWKYHAEFEIVISDISERVNAEQMINQVAKELGVRLMSDSEIIEFTSNYNTQYTYES